LFEEEKELPLRILVAMVYTPPFASPPFMLELFSPRLLKLGDVTISGPRMPVLD
jgi:hypothetical protein